MTKIEQQATSYVLSIRMRIVVSKTAVDQVANLINVNLHTPLN